jgi:hypothetical protein
VYFTIIIIKHLLFIEFIKFKSENTNLFIREKLFNNLGGQTNAYIVC